MSPSLTQLQADVVNAFLDEFEEDADWVTGFVHAEFSLSGGTPQSLVEAFLIRSAPDPKCPDFVPIGWPTIKALEALHVGYRAAGQPFERLDLQIAAPDGRYRFEFSQQPSLRLAGEPDPAAESDLAERYAALLRKA